MLDPACLPQSRSRAAAANQRSGPEPVFRRAERAAEEGPPTPAQGSSPVSEETTCGSVQNVPPEEVSRSFGEVIRVQGAAVQLRDVGIEHEVPEVRVEKQHLAEC